MIRVYSVLANCQHTVITKSIEIRQITRRETKLIRCHLMVSGIFITGHHRANERNSFMIHRWQRRGRNLIEFRFLATSNYKDMVKSNTLTHCIHGMGNNTVVHHLWMGIHRGCQAFSVTHRIIRLANMLRSLIYQRILKISGCISHLTVWNRRCICG